jgi:hypothetical protein
MVAVSLTTITPRRVTPMQAVTADPGTIAGLLAGFRYSRGRSLPATRVARGLPMGRLR